jgi:hypothetical protein
MDKKNNDEERSPAEIRAAIAETRARMDGTIDDIQRQLDPDYIKARAKTALRSEASRRADELGQTIQNQVTTMGTSLRDTIKQNPLPAAMVGIGLTWLYFSRGGNGQRVPDRRASEDYPQRYYDDARYGYGYTGQREQESGLAQAARQTQLRAGELTEDVRARAGEVAQGAKETVENVAQGAKETVENVAQGAKGTVESVAWQARQQAHELSQQAQWRTEQARSSVVQTYNQSPLVLGAAAFAVGAAIGMALPGTASEDKLMGDARDKLVSQAQNVAQDAVQRVQQVAQQTVEVAKETAKQEAASQGLDDPQQLIKSASGGAQSSW